LGFFFFMRSSEYARTPTGSDHHIRCRDVSFQGTDSVNPRRLADVKSVTIWFRSSKTDQPGAGTARSLYKSGCDWLYPVGAAWELVRSNETASLSPEQAFCSYKTSDGQAHQVSSDAVNKAIKRAATRLGLDPRQYASHSLRRGGATALFLGGAKDLTIQRFGRWKSDAYKIYTCIDTRQLSTLSARMTTTIQSPMGHARCNHQLHHQRGGTPPRSSR